MKNLFKLKVLDKNNQVLYDIELDQEVIRIGRQHDNDFILDDEKMSRHHAQIVWRENALYIQDLNSSNGVYLNNNRIPPGEPGKILKGGEEIQIGKHKIIVLANRSKATPSPALPGQASSPLPGSEAPDALANLGGTMVIGGADLDEGIFSAAYTMKNSLPRLLVVTGKKTKRHEIQRMETTISREADTDIKIDHPSISSTLHSKIILDEGRFYIKDMGSTNGTFVGEVRVPEASIELYSYIRLGAVGCLFIQNPEPGAKGLDEEELLDRLEMINAITPSQRATIEEDMAKLGYLVGESAVMQKYLSPAEWQKAYQQAQLIEASQKGKNLSFLLWVAIFVGVGILALLAILVYLLLQQK